MARQAVSAAWLALIPIAVTAPIAYFISLELLGISGTRCRSLAVVRNAAIVAVL